LPSTRCSRPRTKPPPRILSNPTSPDEALSLPLKVFTPFSGQKHRGHQTAARFAFRLLPYQVKHRTWGFVQQVARDGRPGAAADRRCLCDGNAWWEPALAHLGQSMVGERTTAFHALRRADPPQAMAGMSHEERLPPSRLSGCCRFGQETFGRTRGNGQDAPKNEPARAGGHA